VIVASPARGSVTFGLWLLLVIGSVAYGLVLWVNHRRKK
jgi:hypothetical protein